jgi:hypothetical protein
LSEAEPKLPLVSATTTIATQDADTDVGDLL